jgi:hypothetical protein
VILALERSSFAPSKGVRLRVCSGRFQVFPPIPDSDSRRLDPLRVGGPPGPLGPESHAAAVSVVRIFSSPVSRRWPSRSRSPRPLSPVYPPKQEENPRLCASAPAHRRRVGSQDVKDPLDGSEVPTARICPSYVLPGPPRPLPVDETQGPEFYSLKMAIFDENLVNPYGVRTYKIKIRVFR